MSNAKNRVWQKRNGTPRQTTDGSGRAFFRLLFVRKNSYRVRDFQENWRKRLNKNQKFLSFWQVKAIKERKIENIVWCHRENVSLLGAGHTTAVWITVCRNFFAFRMWKGEGEMTCFFHKSGSCFYKSGSCANKSGTCEEDFTHCPVGKGRMFCHAA